MSSTVLVTVIALGGLALASSVILYFISQKFKVQEDSRIDQVQEVLPGANCGGCGFAGCRNFAEALVKSDSFDGLACPVGGAPTMSKIASILGREVAESEPKVAVLRCNGSARNRQKTSVYNGTAMCKIEHSLYAGDTDCPYGCLGSGDCVAACMFDAIKIDSETCLPVVDDAKCVACGACVKACPRNLIELRRKAPKDRKIYVACSNCDKGGVAKKACQVACIGCGKCAKTCQFEAITIANNLAYIDSFKCKMCRKCVGECPTGAIIEVGFPPKKVKEEAEVPSSTEKA